MIVPLEVVKSGQRVESFFQRLRCTRERVLFLDFDGTLAPFHVDPARARPYPGVDGLVEDLARRGTRIVIVTGRCLASLDASLGGLHRHEVWAAHGWQRRTGRGEVVEARPGMAVRERLGEAEDCARAFMAPGARLERKIASVALHWRGVVQPAALRMRAEVVDRWRTMSDPALELLPFDGGIELRARGRNKGAAVLEVLDECAPDAACAYLGDDVTDEDAFAAIDGRGLGVLVRPMLRATRAAAWIRPPVGLLTFLHRWRATPLP